MIKTTALSLAAAVLLLAGTASANEWTRTGPNGTVTKSYERGSGLTVNRSGVNGGSSSANVTCSRGGGVFCQRDYTVTGPNGQTVTGQRNTRRGLFRKQSVNTVTLPDGSSPSIIRTGPRYNVARPGRRVRRAVRW
ncbi:MAG: hypothetical protein AAF557_14375 [Pseudomonadota bacterium]